MNEITQVLQPLERKEEKKAVVRTGEDREIHGCLSLFRKVNPCYESLFSHKTQRAAAKRLAKILSYRDLKFLLEVALPAYNADKYTKWKSITPVQLERNLGFVKSWIDQKYQEAAANKPIRVTD